MVQCCYQQVECSTVGTAPRKFSSVSLQLAEDKPGFLHCPDLYFVSQIIYKMIIPTRNYTHVACVYGHWLLLICCPLLNGCEGSMGIMKQCLCFWVLSGIRSATVWVFYVLVLIGGPECVSEHMSLSDRPCEPTSNLYIVLVWSFEEWEGAYSGRQGADPIRLNEPRWEKSKAGVTTAQSHSAR